MIRFIILVKLNNHKPEEISVWPPATLALWVGSLIAVGGGILDELTNPKTSLKLPTFLQGVVVGAFRIDCLLQFASEWNLELNKRKLGV